MRIMMILLLGSLLGACQSTTSLAPACSLKPESGKCRAAHTRYWFDAGSESCKAFIWGGCDGVVPFETLEDCQQTCPVAAEQQPAPALRPMRGY